MLNSVNIVAKCALKKIRPRIKGAVFKMQVINDTFELSETGRSLTRFIRNHQLTPGQANKILQSHPEITRYLGDIPHDWVKLIGKENLKDALPKIKEALSHFAKHTHTPKKTSAKYLNTEAQKFAKTLEGILNTPVEIQYLSRGEIGKAFKLSVNNKHYVFKSFHTNPDKKFLAGCQSMSLETLNAAFVSRNMPKASNRYTQFYMSKYARPQDRDGFILSAFLDETNAGASKHEFRYDIERIRCFDEYGNSIKDTIFDFGGIVNKVKVKMPDGSVKKLDKKGIKLVRIIGDMLKRGDSKGLEEILKKFADTQSLKTAKAVYEGKYNPQCTDSYSWFYNIDKFTKKQYSALKKLGIKFSLPDPNSNSYTPTEDELNKLRKYGFSEIADKFESKIHQV